MQVGFIGLGKMGTRIAIKLHQGGHDVVVWNRSKEPIEELKSQIQNIKTSESIQSLVQSLQKPRIIWAMVPAGEATDEVLSEVEKFIEKEDIIIDGGNSYYKDTEKRSKWLMANGIRFLGIGVSGGIHGQKNGYSLMAGGERSAYGYIVPLLNCLAKPHGVHEYLGVGGAGHFVKMVHNGIEYGMMQSIGEGFEVLKNSKYNFDLSKVAKVWQKGAVISGFLIDRTKEVLEKDKELTSVVGIIEATGEAEWTVETAKEEGVPVEIIERSLNFRKRSKTDRKIQNSFTAKIIASLRNAFGGHPVRQAQGKPVRHPSVQLRTRAQDKEVKKK